MHSLVDRLVGSTWGVSNALHGTGCANVRINSHYYNNYYNYFYYYYHYYYCYYYWYTGYGSERPNSTNARDDGLSLCFEIDGTTEMCDLCIEAG